MQIWDKRYMFYRVEKEESLRTQRKKFKFRHELGEGVGAADERGAQED